MNNEIIIQITSGRGPAECCWVVAQVLKHMLASAEQKGLSPHVVSRTPGIEPGTLVSALVNIKGEFASEFAGQWQGTILCFPNVP